MNKKETVYVLTGVGIGVAGVLAYLASRSTGQPIRMTQFTELREGPLQEHLVTAEQLSMVKGAPPAGHPQYDPRHSYPDRVAPWITDLVSKGWAPLYTIPDREIRALPAEVAW